MDKLSALGVSFAFVGMSDQVGERAENEFTQEETIDGIGKTDNEKG